MKMFKHWLILIGGCLTFTASAQEPLPPSNTETPSDFNAKVKALSNQNQTLIQQQINTQLSQVPQPAQPTTTPMPSTMTNNTPAATTPPATEQPAPDAQAQAETIENGTTPLPKLTPPPKVTAPTESAPTPPAAPVFTGFGNGNSSGGAINGKSSGSSTGPQNQNGWNIKY